MNYKFIISVLLFFSCVVVSQSQVLNTKVEIIEKKIGKRTVLYAQNKTEDTLNIFFMVHAKGYRKSASKPVITDLIPFSSIQVASMIELKDQPTSYTFDLVINGNATESSFDYDNLPKDIKRIIQGKLVLFTGVNCEKCSELIAALESKHIKYDAIDINEKPVYYRQFINYIHDDLTINTSIRLPLIWNKDHVIFGYDELEVVLEELK